MHYQRFLKTGDPGTAETQRRRIDPKATEKPCTMCGETKLMEAFQVQRRSAHGRQSWCRACTRIANFAGKHGFDLDEVREFVQTHEIDGCTICGVEEDLVIDHEGDRMRGILCRRCNTGIGMLGHDASRIKAALMYLTMGVDVTATAS